MTDPDCAAGKHRSYIGDPCDCDCHTPEQLDVAEVERLAR